MKALLGYIFVVALLAVICCSLAGCGRQSIVPQVTITHPDGTVETRTDIEAMQFWFASLDAILGRIEAYERAKAEAEAAGDKDTVDYLDRLIDLAERELDRRHATAAAPATPTP